MVTYYSDDSVEVTSNAVRVEGRAYSLRELGYVWHRAGRRRRRTVAARAGLGLVPLIPAALAVAVAVTALRIEIAPVSRLVLLVVAGMLALAAVPLLDLALGRVERTYDRGSRTHEIWARWRGGEVLLVRTGDGLRFGRIYRALERALTGASGSPRPGPERPGRSARSGGRVGRGTPESASRWPGPAGSR